MISELSFRLKQLSVKKKFNIGSNVKSKLFLLEIRDVVFLLVCALYFHYSFSALTTTYIHSFQSTRSQSKKPKAEGNEELSGEVDPGTHDFSAKPEEAEQVGNTEASSEKAISADRSQVDPTLSGIVTLSDEKINGYVAHGGGGCLDAVKLYLLRTVV